MTTVVSTRESSQLTGAPQASIDHSGLEPEDVSRAMLYRLVARFLSAPPTEADLKAGSELQGDRSPLGLAVTRFADQCRGTTPEAAADAFHTLFIGLGRGELVPYASYYLTGFLQEKPLARLRGEMARLGIARSADVAEPEDHISSVLEIMAGMIDGSFGAPAGHAEQKAFFDGFLAAWAGHFFKDVTESETSPFYSAVGEIGALLMEIETEAFRMI